MEAVPTWNLTKASMLIQVLGKAVRASSCVLSVPGSGTAVGTTSSGQACQLWKTNPNLGTKGKTTMEHKEAIISLECGCAAGTSILSVDFT